MSTNLFVIPGVTAEGLPMKIRNPATGRHIAATGEEVPDVKIIRRHIADKSLTVGAAPVAVEAEPVKASRASRAQES